MWRFHVIKLLLEYSTILSLILVKITCSSHQVFQESPGE